MLGMMLIISSTGSCQVRCVSLDVATILCIVTPHDREGPEAWPYARHERDILTREDKEEALSQSCLLEVKSENRLLENQ